MECLICGSVYRQNVKCMGIISDGVKTICLCNGCFIKVFDRCLGQGGRIKTLYEEYKDLYPKDDMTLSRFTRSYLIDECLTLAEVERVKRGKVKGVFVNIVV